MAGKVSGWRPAGRRGPGFSGGYRVPARASKSNGLLQFLEVEFRADLLEAEIALMEVVLQGIKPVQEVETGL